MILTPPRRSRLLRACLLAVLCGVVLSSAPAAAQDAPDDETWAKPVDLGNEAITFVLLGSKPRVVLGQYLNDDRGLPDLRLPKWEFHVDCAQTEAPQPCIETDLVPPDEPGDVSLTCDVTVPSGTEVRVFAVWRSGAGSYCYRGPGPAPPQDASNTWEYAVADFPQMPAPVPVDAISRAQDCSQMPRSDPRDPVSGFPRVTFPWFADGKEKGRSVYRTPLLDFVELYDFVAREGGTNGNEA